MNVRMSTLGSMGRIRHLALLCTLLLGGCSLFYKSIRPQWVEAQVRSSSESILYEVLHISLQRADYPVGTGVDKARREIVTGWFRSESPFKGKGYRQKATVVYVPLEGGLFEVRVRVQRETNESVRPLDLRHAEWEEAEDNRQEAVRILQYVRSFLTTGEDLEVGPGPRRSR